MHGRRIEVQPFQRLHELARHDVREVGERLPHFHDRAAEVAHGVEHAEGRLPVRFRQRPFVLIRTAKPAADPVKEVSGRDPRLQRAQ